jgi:hypothetical protein
MSELEAKWNDVMVTIPARPLTHTRKQGKGKEEVQKSK